MVGEKREIIPCPYCVVKGIEEEGCCACDYSGYVYKDTCPVSLKEAEQIVQKLGNDA